MWCCDRGPETQGRAEMRDRLAIEGGGETDRATDTEGVCSQVKSTMA